MLLKPTLSSCCGLNDSLCINVLVSGEYVRMDVRNCLSICNISVVAGATDIKHSRSLKPECHHACMQSQRTLQRLLVLANFSLLFYLRSHWFCDVKKTWRISKNIHAKDHVLKDCVYTCTFTFLDVSHLVERC